MMKSVYLLYNLRQPPIPSGFLCLLLCRSYARPILFPEWQADGHFSCTGENASDLRWSRYNLRRPSHLSPLACGALNWLPCARLELPVEFQKCSSPPCCLDFAIHQKGKGQNSEQSKNKHRGSPTPKNDMESLVHSTAALIQGYGALLAILKTTQARGVDKLVGIHAT